MDDLDAPPATDFAWVPGGTFTMGSDRHESEEAPSHPTAVDGFWMPRHQVTNEQFRAFVDATGYLTVAERPLEPAEFPGVSPERLAPGSMVFSPTRGPVDLRDLNQWWRWQPGTNLKRRWDHPVVHVAYEDAEAYSGWAGGSLPTEAEWERAARGNRDGATFTWGDDERPDGRIMANYWDGPDFPWRSTGESGFDRTASVGSFPANDFGLYDMAGNVWEWTSDWYRDRHSTKTDDSCCAPTNPRGGSELGSLDRHQPHVRTPRKVIKSGSHLCAASYCLRCRPAARRPQMMDTGMSHIGFRCIVRV